MHIDYSDDNLFISMQVCSLNINGHPEGCTKELMYWTFSSLSRQWVMILVFGGMFMDVWIMISLLTYTMFVLIINITDE